MATGSEEFGGERRQHINRGRQESQSRLIAKIEHDKQSAEYKEQCY